MPYESRKSLLEVSKKQSCSQTLNIQRISKPKETPTKLSFPSWLMSVFVFQSGRTSCETSLMHLQTHTLLACQAALSYKNLFPNPNIDFEKNWWTTDREALTISFLKNSQILSFQVREPWQEEKEVKSIQTERVLTKRRKEGADLVENNIQEKKTPHQNQTIVHTSSRSISCFNLQQIQSHQSV